MRGEDSSVLCVCICVYDRMKNWLGRACERRISRVCRRLEHLKWFLETIADHNPDYVTNGRKAARASESESETWLFWQEAAALAPVSSPFVSLLFVAARCVFRCVRRPCLSRECVTCMWTPEGARGKRETCAEWTEESLDRTGRRFVSSFHCLSVQQIFLLHCFTVTETF